MVVVDVREGIMLTETVNGGGEVRDDADDIVRCWSVIERQDFYIVNQLKKFGAGDGRVGQIFAVAAEFAKQAKLVKGVKEIAVQWDG